MIADKNSETIYNEIVQRVTAAGHTMTRASDSGHDIWEVDGYKVRIGIRHQYKRFGWRDKDNGKPYIQVASYIYGNHALKPVNYPQKADGSFNWTKIADTIVEFSRNEKLSQEIREAEKDAVQAKKDFAKEIGIESWYLLGAGKYKLDIYFSREEVQYIVNYLKAHRKPETMPFLAK